MADDDDNSWGEGDFLADGDDDEDDSKHGPMPTEAKLFVIEALEGPPWTPEEQQVHAAMRAEYEAETSEGNAKQLIDSYVKNVENFAEQAVDAHAEWMAQVTTELIEQAREGEAAQRRHAKICERAKKRAAAADAQLVAAAERAREAIRLCGNPLAPSCLDGSGDVRTPPGQLGGGLADPAAGEEAATDQGGGSGSRRRRAPGPDATVAGDEGVSARPRACAPKRWRAWSAAPPSVWHLTEIIVAVTCHVTRDALWGLLGPVDQHHPLFRL